VFHGLKIVKIAENRSIFANFSHMSLSMICDGWLGGKVEGGNFCTSKSDKFPLERILSQSCYRWTQKPAVHSGMGLDIIICFFGLYINFNVCLFLTQNLSTLPHCNVPWPYIFGKLYSSKSRRTARFPLSFFNAI
jgi:hypothetical protein